jgi:type VI secretion system secreted protein VgrG
MSLLELTVTGGASLSVRQLSIHEGVSELFTVEVVARSEASDIDIDRIVGHDASLHVEPNTPRPGQGTRTWKGICSSMELMAVETTGLSTYRIEIVPTLWLLTQRVGHRIYQRMSIPDIIDSLLREWLILPEWNVTRALYPKLEYKVQYGETDFAFFSRLLEEAGIAYTFPDEHGLGGKLTFDDVLHTRDARPGQPLHFVDNPNLVKDTDLVTQVRLVQDVRPGASTFRDYDFRNPAFELAGKAPPVLGSEAKYEYYG